MMLSLLVVCVSLTTAQSNESTQDKAAAIVAEMPKAPGEGGEPAEAKAMEAEMDAKKAGAPLSKKKKETKDWADEERWGRYREDDPEASAPQKRQTPPGANVLLDWPNPLRHRSPGGAFVLGALVGFGSGHYYAGEARRGVLFSAIDGALVLGFIGTTVAMNKLVIDHDFKTGKSLANGDRDFGKVESQLYVASVLFALAEVGSRVFQGIGSMQAARRTNAVLEGVT